MTEGKQKGFSLIELLIVVAIILIIAAIAIPNLMRARMAANDSSAAASERSIITAEVGYFAAYPQIGYPATLAILGGALPCTPSVATGCLIDNTLAQNGNPAGSGKSGYKFTAAGVVPAGGVLPVEFYTTASPIGGATSTTGTRTYCAVDDGVVRTNNPPAAGPPPGGYAACQAYIAMNN